MAVDSIPQNPRQSNADSRPADKPGRMVWHDLPCPGCAYNLRGIRESRCPECARPFTIKGVLRQSYGASDWGFWRMYDAALLHPRSFWRDSGRRLTVGSAFTFALGCSALGACLFTMSFAVLLAAQDIWTWPTAIAASGIMFVGAILCLTIAFTVVAAAVGLLRMLCGQFTEGAGWRAATAVAVWFPAWSLSCAILIADCWNALPNSVFVSDILRAGSIVFTLVPAIATVYYMGIAAKNEMRADAEP